MGKRFNTLDGHDFMRMVTYAARVLDEQKTQVNALNVFPVPDGDTGTNMSMTFSSGAEEMRKGRNRHIGKAAEALAKGLLMGARGNSGVILSQLFRGFAKFLHDKEEIGAAEFASALQSGVETAYKAVVKPVEGTILTVAREAARGGAQHAKRSGDVAEVLQEAIDLGREALMRTPEMLPVLKQVGVVDAGGQGLMIIYEGFLSALLSDAAGPEETPSDLFRSPLREGASPRHVQPVQARLATEDIEYGYCTEFMIKLGSGQNQDSFDESEFRREIGRFGDSLLVVSDEQLVKVHIHAEYPGDVLNFAMKYGELTRIKIENMREQHSHIVRDIPEQTDTGMEPRVEQTRAVSHPDVFGEPQAAGHTAATQRERYGIVAVASGEGMAEIFTSLGVDVVLSGGQTMNPSTENIVEAIRRIDADTVFVLPNNSNIIMAARQAGELVEDKRVITVPSTTIPQGFAAVLAFSGQADEEANSRAMNAALKKVRSGQVTYAVRDTVIDGVSIDKDDFIGILDNKIVISDPQLGEACKKLLQKMIHTGEEVVTIYCGEGGNPRETAELERFLRERYPDLEVEVHEGGQPVYSYIFSVE